jgi:peptide/nickel transport system ATP-binding protein
MSIVNLFRQIVEEQGVSFIYITHDLSTAYYLSDQVAIMNRGRVVEQGLPTDILDNPAEDYTRELMAAIPGVDSRWSELAEIDARYSRTTTRQQSAPTHPLDNA